MKQEDYRSCMATGLKGKKGLSREERQLLFCVQSRLCSGKAKTPEEAKTICLSQPPKEPKARRSRRRPEGCPPCPPCSSSGAVAPPIAENLTCPQRKDRVVNTIEDIIDKVREGNAEAALAGSELVKKDVAACFPDEEVVTLANGAHDYIKQLGKNYYFKGEIHELKDQLGALKVLIGG